MTETVAASDLGMSGESVLTTQLHTIVSLVSGAPTLGAGYGIERPITDAIAPVPDRSFAFPINFPANPCPLYVALPFSGA